LNKISLIEWGIHEDKKCELLTELFDHYFFRSLNIEDIQYILEGKYDYIMELWSKSGKIFSKEIEFAIKSLDKSELGIKLKNWYSKYKSNTI
jgi:hypothetical protein